MKLSDTQDTKPPAKVKSSARATDGQSHQSSQSWGQPTREEIVAKAYQLYVESGRREGRDTENWLRAEQLLREQNGGGAGSQGSQNRAGK